MSLLILVAGVAVGISVIVGAVHLTGGSRPAVLAGAEDARARFALDFPDEPPSEVWLAGNRRTAFLALDGRRLGIVHAVGRHFLTRIVVPGDVVHLECEGETLKMRLADFTWRGGSFVFETAKEAQAVAAALREHDKAGQREAA